MSKKIFLFLFDGFSDWEIAYLTPEINKNEKYDLIYFSENETMITSAGGLQIMPKASLPDLKADDIDMLILPGGTAWEKGEVTALQTITKDVFERGKPIAAICAATTFLGQLGLLDNLKHTSNAIDYLRMGSPKYKGEAYYQNALAVTDKNIITASGVAPIEFAQHIFKALNLFDDELIEKWFQLFKNGIMNS